MRYAQEDLDRAVQMYDDGDKTDKITEETGVPRNVLYYHLRAIGKVPQRVPPEDRGRSRTDPKNMGEVKEVVGWLMAEHERLAAENLRLRRQLTDAGIEPLEDE